tara:strand:- start:4893 stop:6293 length:1401 start_codon:yes stop_codon:yes gene_type:complete
MSGLNSTNHLDVIPGLGVVESLTIENAVQTQTDVLALMQELTITQNLYDTFITGTLVLSVVDGVLESNQILLNGQETLGLTVRSSTSYSDDGGVEKGKAIRGNFVIHSINKDRVDPNATVITIKFVSKEAIKNRYTKISKWFEPQRKSEMVKKIYDNYLKDEDPQGVNTKEFNFLDDTEDSEFTCVVPNWSPIQTIRWLMDSSTSSEDPSCKHFVFYESWNGDFDDQVSKFNLRAWSLLNKQQPIASYLHQPLKLETTAIDLFQHRNIEFTKPLELDLEKSISKGTFGSKLIMHDLFRKKIIRQNFSYNEDIEPQNWPKKFLNEEKRNIISSADMNPSTEVKVLHTNRYSFRTNETVEGNEKYKKWLQSSLSQNETTSLSTVQLTIVGDTSRHPGEVININKPLLQIKEDGKFENIQDKNVEIGGKWLVVGVTHTFRNSAATKNYVTETYLQCKKDGMPSLEGIIE